MSAIRKLSMQETCTKTNGATVSKEVPTGGSFRLIGDCMRRLKRSLWGIRCPLGIRRGIRRCDVMYMYMYVYKNGIRHIVSVERSFVLIVRCPGWGRKNLDTNP